MNRHSIARRGATRQTSRAAEPLEPRLLFATFTVTSAGDAGPGSLREAVTFANNSFGPDTIAFDVPGPGRVIIRPVEPLPPLTEPAVIDGTTQPGWSPGNPVVELDGADAIASDDQPLAGLRLTGGTTVRGLSVYNWSDPSTAPAVELTGAGNAVEGNRIGLDATGAPGPNDIGVLVAGTMNTVGGINDPAAARNVIAASEVAGVRVGTRGEGAAPWRNTIAGNYIGTTPGGAGAAANATGVLLDGRAGSAAHDTSVLNNVISGNTVGVRVAGPQAFGNFLHGNSIGESAAGEPLPNASHGVWISEGAARNRVGEELPPVYSNRIRHNGGDGVRLDALAHDNTVQSNQIAANAGSGIDLFESDANSIRHNLIGGRADDPGLTPIPDGNGADGVTLGNFADLNQVTENTLVFNAGDGVAVGRVAFDNGILRNSIYRNVGAGIRGGHSAVADIRSVVSTGAATFVWGHVATRLIIGFPTSLVPYHIELFATDPATGGDAGGPGAAGSAEGQRFVGSVDPRTNENGIALFFAELPALPAGTLITATVSISLRDVGLETGPFSAAVPVPPTPDTPRVAQVFVRSDEWSAEFNRYLQSAGLGSSRYGYAVPSDNIGPHGHDHNQGLTLPWINLNQAFVAFTEPVSADVGDVLLVKSDGSGYRRDGYTYDAAHRVGGWNLEPTWTADRVTLRVDGTTSRAVVDADGNKLDGDWPRLYFPSGNGSSGPDFRFRMNVLPGDADRTGERVDGSDVAGVRSRRGSRAGQGGGLHDPYHVFADVNGDARIDLEDYVAVRRRATDSLPPLTAAASAGDAPLPIPHLLRSRPRARSSPADLLR